MFCRLVLFLCCYGFSGLALSSTLNVFALGGEIPQQAIHQFERESGIHVNLSTFDVNEALNAKLRFTHDYDVLLFSSYFVSSFKKLGFIQPIDRKQILSLAELNPAIRQISTEDYFVPFVWGVTGIFYHNTIASHPQYWRDLWSPAYHHQLLLLDDMREVFSMALMVLGYSPNDDNVEHLEEAYRKLLSLRPNIRLFSTNTVQSVLIDEDVKVGMAWNSDVFKAQLEGAKDAFVYPQDGFVIWVDGFAVARQSKQPDAAHRFINFMLKPAVAKTVLLEYGLLPSNQMVKLLLPPSLRQNPLLSPPQALLGKGHVQKALSPQALFRMTHLWERFKSSI